jgi:hypothetical protein
MPIPHRGPKKLGVLSLYDQDSGIPTHICVVRDTNPLPCQLKQGKICHEPTRALRLSHPSLPEQLPRPSANKVV